MQRGTDYNSTWVHKSNCFTQVRFWISVWLKSFMVLTRFAFIPSGQTGDGRTALNDKYGYWLHGTKTLLRDGLNVPSCTISLLQLLVVDSKSWVSPKSGLFWIPNLTNRPTKGAVNYMNPPLPSSIASHCNLLLLLFLFFKEQERGSTKAAFRPLGWFDGSYIWS